MINIGKFKQILEENFPIKKWERKLHDKRKRPIIPAGTIFKLAREMVFLGQRSLLSVDEFGKKGWALKWHKSKRKDVASDTTMERSLEGFEIEELREILRESYECLGNMGGSYKILPSGKRMKVGIVDGSDFGGFRSVVFTIGGLVNSPLDLEPYSMGKELNSTKILLSRVKTRFGRGCVDIILEDGLHLTKDNILQCKTELGTEVLLKTKEENLSIIQDARGLFFRGEAEIDDGIERVEGIDTTRMVEYRITACAGFRWQDIPFEFKVAHVFERKIKPIKGRPDVEEFWVVTTDTSLSAEDIRELAHFRWEIENNTFKRLNFLVGSKRSYIRNANVKKVLLLIWFIGLILFGFCMMMRKLEGEKRPKETLRTMVEAWYDFVILLWKNSSS